MTEREAIYRLNDHFDKHKKDEPVSHYIDEAQTMAIQALNNQIWLKNLIADYYKDPTAVKGEAILHDLCRVFLYPLLREEAFKQSIEYFEKLCEKHEKTKTFQESCEGDVIVSVPLSKKVDIIDNPIEPRNRAERRKVEKNDSKN